MTLIETSKNVDEERLIPNLLDKRKKRKPHIQLKQLVRTSDIEKAFSK